MKQTPFTPFHIALGAKMHEFAGYNMPIEYKNITEEHMHVCTKVGVFDVSHMGQFWVKGPEALAYLQTICSNDIATLAIGKAQYNCFPNGKGGIVDDLIVYHYSEQKYLLVVNGANIEKDWNWCNTHNTFGVTLQNASEETALLALQGPMAQALLQTLMDVDLSSIPYYGFAVGNIGTIKEAIISNTGYTGAGGYELYVHTNDAIALWEQLFKVGEAYDLQPIGLGARDTLRLEMGYALYGHELDDTTSPIEAGLGWITKLPEGKELIDKALILSHRTEGVSRKLVGFELIDKGIPRNDYEITTLDGEVIGRVTSGSISPTRKIGIGMGYVASDYAKVGTEIGISVRNKILKAVVVKPPFRKLETV